MIHPLCPKCKTTMILDQETQSLLCTSCKHHYGIMPATGEVVCLDDKAEKKEENPQEPIKKICPKCGHERVLIPLTNRWVCGRCDTMTGPEYRSYFDNIVVKEKPSVSPVNCIPSPLCKVIKHFCASDFEREITEMINQGWTVSSTNSTLPEKGTAISCYQAIMVRS